MVKLKVSIQHGIPILKDIIYFVFYLHKREDEILAQLAFGDP